MNGITFNIADLKKYASKEELQSYATIQDLDDYAPKSELDNYASKTDLNSYTTTSSFDAHVNSSTNPHSVTKSQVGLGNVPNVSTNDQTPTYSASSSLSALTSGEKLSVAFGKIAKAISDLISHIANKNNPHGVTISQIGAAASTHKHAASDITSGYFAVERGGTGRNSKTVNSNDYEFRAIKLQTTVPTTVDTGCIVLVYDTSGWV